MICWGGGNKTHFLIINDSVRYSISFHAYNNGSLWWLCSHNKRQSNMFPVFARVITATRLLPTLGNRTKLQSKRDCRVFQKLEWNHLNGFQTQCVLRLVFLFTSWLPLASVGWNCETASARQSEASSNPLPYFSLSKFIRPFLMPAVLYPAGILPPHFLFLPPHSRHMRE